MLGFRFFPAKAKSIIEDILTTKLKNIQYDASKSAELTEEIARAIRSRIKTGSLIA